MNDLRVRRSTRLVALAAMLAALGACGHTAGAERGAPPSSAANGSRETSGFNSPVLDLAVPATGAQYTVGARFMGTMQALESGIAATCMAGSGFQMARIPAAAATAADFDNSQFPDLATIGRNAMFGPDTPGPNAPQSAPSGRGRSYDSAATRCSAAANRQFASLNHAVGGLESPWMTIVGQIESSAPVRAELGGFRSCMEQAGVPAADVNAPSSADAFGGFLAWETGLETSAKTDAATRAIQRHWAPIFVHCAKPAVAVLERLQSQQRTGFLQQHLQQVTALQRLAGPVISPAAKE